MQALKRLDSCLLKTRTLAALLLLCVGLSGACGGNGGEEKAGTGSVEVSRDPVLLPADAREIVDEVHARANQANATLDERIQASIETSPALDVDDAFFKRFRALGRASVPSPGDVQEAVTYVPKQTSYPAHFLAYLKTAVPDDRSTPALNWLWLFQKEAAEEPWKLAMYVTLPADFAPPDIMVDDDGFALTVSGQEAAGLKLAPSRLPEELAGYLSGYAAGSDSPVFAPGVHTSELSQGLKAQSERDAEGDINSSVEVEAGEFPVQAFKTADGGALALFSANMATRYEAAPGKTLKPIRGSEGLLEPGEYATIQRNIISMMAAVIPPEGSEELVQIVGSTGGTVSFEATSPGPPSPSPPPPPPPA